MCIVTSDVRVVDPIHALRDLAHTSLSEEFLAEVESGLATLPNYLHTQTNLMIASQRALRRAADAADIGDVETLKSATEEYAETMEKLRLEKCSVANKFIWQLSESHRLFPQDLRETLGQVIHELIAPTADRIEERLSRLETAVTTLLSKRGPR